MTRMRDDEGGGSRRADLHARVRAFITAAARGRPTGESFDELGTAIARYQAERTTAYARLLSARAFDRNQERLAAWPAVPTDAFKLTRVAAHPPEEDRAVFRTSGTTAAGDQRGVQRLSTTATYQTAALAWGAWGLFPDRAPPAPLLVPPHPERDEPPLVWVVAAPPPAHARDSSLGFMLELFGRHFAREVIYVVEVVPGVEGGRVDLGALDRALERAERLGAQVAVGGTSFAFVHLIDAACGRHYPLPARGRVMHTGGFKGKSRKVPASELRRAIADLFAVDERAVVGEYGMTELSSQLYEGTLRAALGLDAPAEAREGVFFAPPWVRVVPVSGERLEPVPAGEVGLLRIEDLANVDTAVALQTADLGRRVGESGVELLERAPAAESRGCSIAVDALLGG